MLSAVSLKKIRVNRARRNAAELHWNFPIEGLQNLVCCSAAKPGKFGDASGTSSFTLALTHATLAVRLLVVDTK